MKRFTLTAFFLLLTVAIIGPWPAGAGNGAPNGTHYNLNIIGVKDPKTAPLTNSDRHTIFVALDNNGSVPSNIYLTPGEFQVCDGNAFDSAYDCSGAEIASHGAVFQLPCNNNVTPVAIGCSADTAQGNYTVWARALGTPTGTPWATISTCATAPDGSFVCSTGNKLMRSKGKQLFTNVTKALTSLQNVCFTQGVDAAGNPVVVCESVALFADGFQDFLWQYDNHGLKLAQVRFYYE